MSAPEQPQSLNTEIDSVTTDSFLKYFGFSDHPFLNSSNPEYQYISRTHRQAKSHLEYAMQIPDGVSIVTGDYGTGKKMLIQDSLSNQDDSICVIEIKSSPKDELDLLKTIVTSLGKQFLNPDKEQLLNIIYERVLEQQALSSKIILILYQVQDYNVETLEQIRNLSDIKINNQRTINVLLSGNPELYKHLDELQMSQLTRRVRYRIHINTLNESETYEYILHRLNVAGCNDPTLFSSSAIDYIYHTSSGHPKYINELCSFSLIRAFVEHKSIIDLELVKKAGDELQKHPKEHKIVEKLKNYQNSIQMLTKSRPKFMLYLKGNFLGEYSLLDSIITIGRSKDNDIYIDDPRISRYHATISTQNDVTVIKDLDSTNGIFVNKVNTRLSTIEDDDVIQIGIHQIKVVHKIKFVNKEDEFEKTRKSISDTIETYLTNVDKILKSVP
ncbi:MAG: FHA domain-containing protein [Gammaproteobacteria bacterium]